MILVLLLIFNMAVASADTGYEVEVLELINAARAKEHLKPLRLSKSLSRGAQIRAVEITKKFSHTRPSGYSCFTVVQKTYKLIGENIAAGQISPKEVVAAWLNSPSHRANILNPKFRELGVGYVYLPDSKYKHYWAQLFRLRR